MMIFFNSIIMIILGETKAKETFCDVKTFKVRDRVKDKNNELIFFGIN